MTADGTIVTEPGTDTPDPAEAPRGSAGNRRPAWRNPVAIVAAVALVAVTAVLRASLGGTEDAAVDDIGEVPPEVLVDEFAGAGDDATSSFTVEGPWEVRWESEGKAFHLELLDADGESVQTVVDHEGQGGGSNYLTQDSTYSLDVTADGDWSIRVYEYTE